MLTDSKVVEKVIRRIDEVWARIKPGKRVCGTDANGVFHVYVCEDLTVPIASFPEEAESVAFASAPTDIALLMEYTKKLTKERDAALAALKEIRGVADPALEAFDEQRPVDMAKVLKTAHRWTHHVLD